MKHITTDIEHHYISTVWLEALGFWETMVFERKTSNKIDWTGKHQERTDNPDRAIVNHCDAIWFVVEWERKVG